MLGRRLRRARRTRTSRPCRTGGRGRCRGCRGRRRRPRGGSRSRSRRSAGAGRSASRIWSACRPASGDLGGADEEELVLGDLVDLVAVAGKEAGPVQRLLADQHRRHDRLVALGADQLQREADQGQLEQHQVALQVGEAGAREPRRRLHLDQAQLGADLEVVAGLEVEARASRRPRAARPRPPRSSRRGRRGRAGSAAPWRPARSSASTRSSSALPDSIVSFSACDLAHRPSASSPLCFASPICLESVLRSAWAPSISGSSSRRRASSASSSSTARRRRGGPAPP